jgi:tRNA threonylcarbamoyl adenosine modification protein YeaZ
LIAPRTLHRVALGMAGKTHARTIEKGRHAAELVPVMDRLLAEKRVAYSELACIITTTGPGSFTGLRIALSVAHGLHLAHHTPIKCTSGLAAIAHAHVDNTPLRAVMAVGKGEVAYQDFDGKGHPVGDITRTSEDDAALLACKHRMIGTWQHEQVQPVRAIDASWLCAMEPDLPTTPIAEATPLYIRPPDAIIPETPRWLAS